MDVPTIDHEYQELQNQAQQTIGELKELAGKLSTAAQGGNQDAKEWLLDLKSVALAVQAEQNQVMLLLQALHGFVANQGQALLAQPPQQQPNPWAQQPQQSPYPPQNSGGLLGSFLNSGFGRALTLGAGFGIGDDLINSIF